MTQQQFTRISYWLVPCAEDLTGFQNIIDLLADEWSGPTFLPHLTIFAGGYSPDDLVEELVRGAFERIGPVTLPVEGLGCTDLYTQTLFVRFGLHPDLVAVSEYLRSQSQLPSEYQLQPHLSLMYNHLQECDRQVLQERLRPQIPAAVTFTKVLVVPAQRSTTTQEDVQSWKPSFEMEIA